MYSEENSDKESDREGLPVCPVAARRSLSTVGFRSECGHADTAPAPLRATRSFTGALDYPELQRLSISEVTNVACPEPDSKVCPCGCYLSPPPSGPFRTRDRNTLALHLVPADAVRPPGRTSPHICLAALWKKDCRTYLWKGQARARADLVAVPGTLEERLAPSELRYGRHSIIKREYI